MMPRRARTPMPLQQLGTGQTHFAGCSPETALNATTSVGCDPRWVGLTAKSIESLPPESAIPTLLRRMWDSVEDDPDLAIGAAKEAIEATAKHLLVCAGETVGSAETMPSLIARSQKLLDVHPATVAPTKDGVDTIKSILGALSQAALGINALRRDYGSGHGRPTRSSGLKARHARLATQAADAWVRFMLDTADARVASADAARGSA
jgi:Abortive infection C-terminus